MSPMRSPGQPSNARASLDKRSRKSSSWGVPQLRLRDSRITCQSGPLMGSDTPPARQPFAYEPIARAVRGAGADAAPNRLRAIGDLGVGFFEAGFGTGLGGTVVAAVLGVACSAATTAQNKRRMRLKASLRISVRLEIPLECPLVLKTLAQM